jgi:hypothetical protein
MADRMTSPTSVEPLEVELFMDYHCPYSHRVAAWLDGLGPERVAVRHRLFGLEQVNRDPTATEWRLWEQPLDYVHHGARRFRAGVYAARFDERLDIADPDVLDRLASAAGAVPDRVPAGLSDTDAIEAARRRIAVDWAAARADYMIFGVPTLRVGRARPFYLRLARPVDPAEGPRFLDALLAFRAAAPDVLELKLPEPVKPA